MKIAILGFARDGQAAYEYWNRDGNELTICDEDTSIKVPDDASSQLGPDYLKNLVQFDIIVRTAGLPPKLITQANPDSPDILNKVTGNIDEFMRVCPTKNIIGVTGTKGKGTTCTLTAKMLEATGKRVHLGGNIGISALELLKNDIQPDDWVVLETGAFQLIDIKRSPYNAVCLSVEAEHLDWFTTLDKYLLAKQQLFVHQSHDDIAIYYADNNNAKQIASVSPGQKIPYMKSPGAEIINNQVTIDGQTICDINEIKLLGKHNWQNVCAAVTAIWQVAQGVQAIKSVLTTFVGLPFRIELRREIDGIKFYNDSFASAQDATVAAIEAIPGSKVIIIGGYDRGLPLQAFAQQIKQHERELRKVVIIGETGDKIIAALHKVGFSNFIRLDDKDMPTIVRLAKDQAEVGDAVVLSPGFASFDMFKNFEVRGQKFNEAVENL